MTNKEMSIESVSPDLAADSADRVDEELDTQRVLQYKTFSAAFSYPDDNFFALFPQLVKEKQNLTAEYDRLFRTGKVWLYGAEYLAENEFQRANLLSDIMGFYKAFGLEPDKERPDSINCELEFMHFLIVKRDRIHKGHVTIEPSEKADTCWDAEKKFFTEHLAPVAKQIAENVISKSKNRFYVQAASALSEFIEHEKRLLECEENQRQKIKSIERGI
ncbi:MAG: TorD/DmsD family molecular chaperone [Planctomycetota bacterium]|jgi:TorA maturation chaperone TorD